MDGQGQCYVLHGAPHYEWADFAVELGKIEAALGVVGETLESVYGETYVAKKRGALRRAGIPFVHIEIEPEGLSVN